MADIDLFTGGLIEDGGNSSIVGPTFSCIISEQFRRLRNCDRFWYETQDAKFGFTRRQLEEIRSKARLSTLVCNNCDFPSPIQPWAMDIVDRGLNPLQPCEDHPKLDLTLWTDREEEEKRGRQLRHNYCDFYGRVAIPGETARIGACSACRCGVNGTNSTCFAIEEENLTCSKLISQVGEAAVKLDFRCDKICSDHF